MKALLTNTLRPQGFKPPHASRGVPSTPPPAPKQKHQNMALGSAALATGGSPDQQGGVGSCGGYTHSEVGEGGGAQWQGNAPQQQQLQQLQRQRQRQRKPQRNSSQRQTQKRKLEEEAPILDKDLLAQIIW